MSYVLIGQDMRLEVQNGGYVDGTPTYSTAQSFLCRARSVSISRQTDQVDVSGLCDTERRYRPTKSSGTLSIEGMVTESGYYWVNPNGSPAVGNYIKVSTKENSAMSTFRVWEGMIQSWEWSASGDEVQIERITITLNPEIDTTP